MPLNYVIAQGDRTPIDARKGNFAFLTNWACDVTTKRQWLLLANTDFNVNRVEKPGKIVRGAVSNYAIDSVFARSRRLIVLHDVLEKIKGGHDVVQRQLV